jgi:hypothetical protein
MTQYAASRWFQNIGVLLYKDIHNMNIGVLGQKLKPSQFTCWGFSRVVPGATSAPLCRPLMDNCPRATSRVPRWMVKLLRRQGFSVEKWCFKRREARRFADLSIGYSPARKLNLFYFELQMIFNWLPTRSSTFPEALSLRHPPSHIACTTVDGEIFSGGKTFP